MEPRNANLLSDGRIDVADAMGELLDHPRVGRAIIGVTVAVPPVAHEARDGSREILAAVLCFMNR